MIRNGKNRFTLFGLTRCDEMIKQEYQEITKKDIDNIDDFKWKEVSKIQRGNRIKDRQKINRDIR